MSDESLCELKEACQAVIDANAAYDADDSDEDAVRDANDLEQSLGEWASDIIDLVHRVERFRFHTLPDRDATIARQAEQIARLRRVAQWVLANVPTEMFPALERFMSNCAAAGDLEPTAAGPTPDQERATGSP